MESSESFAVFALSYVSPATRWRVQARGRFPGMRRTEEPWRRGQPEDGGTGGARRSSVGTPAFPLGCAFDLQRKWGRGEPACPRESLAGGRAEIRGLGGNAVLPGGPRRARVLGRRMGRGELSGRAFLAAVCLHLVSRPRPRTRTVSGAGRDRGEGSFGPCPRGVGRRRMSAGRKVSDGSE